MPQQNLTPNQALQKIKYFCSYQERCHSEVKQKLYDYGLYQKEVDDIVAKMVEENYLNEERFAIQYAGGKFRLKHWGRNKIKYSLKQKQVSDYCIRKGLNQIDDDAYEATFQKLFDEKLRTLKSEKNIFTKKRKLQDHLVQKGYESDIIRSAINKL